VRKLPKPLTIAIPDLPLGWFTLSYKALAYNRLAIIGANQDIRVPFARQLEESVSKNMGFRLKWAL
jgi:hypothetical protein